MHGEPVAVEEGQLGHGLGVLVGLGTVYVVEAIPQQKSLGVALTVVESGGAHQDEVGDLGEKLGIGGGFEVGAVDGITLVGGAAAEGGVQEASLSQHLLGEGHGGYGHRGQEDVQQLVAIPQSEDAQGGHGKDQEQKAEVIQGQDARSALEQGGALPCAGGFQAPCQAAQVGLTAHGDDHGDGEALLAHASREDHIHGREAEASHRLGLGGSILLQAMGGTGGIGIDLPLRDHQACGTEQAAVCGDHVAGVEQDDVAPRQLGGAHAADAASPQHSADGGVVGRHGGVHRGGAVQEEGRQSGIPQTQEQADETEGHSVKEQGYEGHRQKQPQGGLPHHRLHAVRKASGGGAVKGLGGRGVEAALGLLGRQSRGGVYGQVGEQVIHRGGGGIDPAAYLTVAGLFGCGGHDGSFREVVAIRLKGRGREPLGDRRDRGARPFPYSRVTRDRGSRYGGTSNPLPWRQTPRRGRPDWRRSRPFS